MVFVRKLVSICLHCNIVFKAKHIPGVCNKLEQLARAYMDPFLTEVPRYLLPQSWVT